MEYFKKMAAVVLDCVFGIIWVMFYWHILKYCFDAFIFCGPPMVNGHFNMYMFTGWLLFFGIVYWKPCIGYFKEFFIEKISLSERLGLLIQSGVFMLTFLLCGALLYWICSSSGDWGKASFFWCHTELHDQFLSFVRGYNG